MSVLTATDRHECSVLSGARQAAPEIGRTTIMNVIAGSPLDLLAQQFDAHVADGFAKVLHDGDEIRVVAACASIAETAGRFLIQRKHVEDDGAEYWMPETWCSSPVAAAMWALI